MIFKENHNTRNKKQKFFLKLQIFKNTLNKLTKKMNSACERENIKEIISISESKEWRSYSPDDVKNAETKAVEIFLKKIESNPDNNTLKIIFDSRIWNENNRISSREKKDKEEKVFNNLQIEFEKEIKNYIENKQFDKLNKDQIQNMSSWKILPEKKKDESGRKLLNFFVDDVETNSYKDMSNNNFFEIPEKIFNTFIWSEFDSEKKFAYEKKYISRLESQVKYLAEENCQTDALNKIYPLSNFINKPELLSNLIKRINASKKMRDEKREYYKKINNNCSKALETSHIEDLEENVNILKKDPEKKYGSEIEIYEQKLNKLNKEKKELMDNIESASLNFSLSDFSFLIEKFEKSPFFEKEQFILKEKVSKNIIGYILRKSEDLLKNEDYLTTIKWIDNNLEKLGSLKFKIVSFNDLYEKNPDFIIKVYKPYIENLEFDMENYVMNLDIKNIDIICENILKYRNVFEGQCEDIYHKGDFFRGAILEYFNNISEKKHKEALNKLISLKENIKEFNDGSGLGEKLKKNKLLSDRFDEILSRENIAGDKTLLSDLDEIISMDKGWFSDKALEKKEEIEELEKHEKIKLIKNSIKEAQNNKEYKKILTQIKTLENLSREDSAQYEPLRKDINTKIDYIESVLNGAEKDYEKGWISRAYAELTKVKGVIDFKEDTEALIEKCRGEIERIEMLVEDLEFKYTQKFKGLDLVFPSVLGHLELNELEILNKELQELKKQFKDSEKLNNLLELVYDEFLKLGKIEEYEKFEPDINSSDLEPGDALEMIKRAEKILDEFSGYYQAEQKVDKWKNALFKLIEEKYKLYIDEKKYSHALAHLEKWGHRQEIKDIFEKIDLLDGKYKKSNAKEIKEHAQSVSTKAQKHFNDNFYEDAETLAAEALNLCADDATALRLIDKINSIRESAVKLKLLEDKLSRFDNGDTLALENAGDDILNIKKQRLNFSEICFFDKTLIYDNLDLYLNEIESRTSIPGCMRFNIRFDKFVYSYLLYFKDSIVFGRPGSIKADYIIMSTGMAEDHASVINQKGDFFLNKINGVCGINSPDSQEGLIKTGDSVFLGSRLKIEIENPRKDLLIMKTDESQDYNSFDDEEGLIIMKDRLDIGKNGDILTGSDFSYSLVIEKGKFFMKSGDEKFQIHPNSRGVSFGVCAFDLGREESF